MNEEFNIDTLKQKLIEIFNRTSIPDRDIYLELVEQANQVLITEDKAIRPYDSSNLPGGIIFLKQYIPTIIVPDLHARMDFFLNILFYQVEGMNSILEGLVEDKIQIICVGDGFHAERRAISRWRAAFNEYKNEYKKRQNMDEEMKESLGLMEMVMKIKSLFPANFHFLKGNHENITNENGNGNYPFSKFAHEGAMVAYYITKFYDEEFLNTYASFEKNLPIFAVGRNFLISHAEPAGFYNQEELIEYRNNPDVIEGLTWTDNDDAESGSVQDMLKCYLNEAELENNYYFGGHRLVDNLYNKRAKGKYIQIHNPDKFIIAYIKTDKDINLDEDIIELENNVENIVNNDFEIVTDN